MVVVDHVLAVAVVILNQPAQAPLDRKRPLQFGVVARFVVEQVAQQHGKQMLLPALMKADFVVTDEILDIGMVVFAGTFLEAVPGLDT